MQVVRVTLNSKPRSTSVLCDFPSVASAPILLDNDSQMSLISNLEIAFSTLVTVHVHEGLGAVVRLLATGGADEGDGREEGCQFHFRVRKNIRSY